MRPTLSAAVVALTLVSADRLSAQYDPHASPDFPVHSRATVNDPRSHGVIGDRFLSIREAILLTNKDLDEESLSKEEHAQLAGFGNDIAWADIDTNAVPVLTLERNLPLIKDTLHGFTIAGANGTPIIELGDTRGFVAVSDFVDFSNLKLRGGDVAIDVTQLDTIYGSLINGVDFEGQGSAGLRLSMLRPNGGGRIQLEECTFRNLPVAIEIQDVGDGRNTTVKMFNTDVRGCGIGIDVLLGTGGRQTMSLNGLHVTGGNHAMRIRRTAGTTRNLTFEGRYFVLDGVLSALAIEGHAVATTRLIFQALDLRSPVATIDLGPSGSNLDLTLQDSRIRGASRIAGGSSGRIALENCHLRNGSLVLGTTGASVAVESSVIDSVSISTIGSRAITIDSSRLAAGSLQGTATAPIQVTGCHLTGTSVGSNTTVGQALNDAPLGTFDVTPTDPPVGTTLTLHTDLPPKLSGLYLFGTAVDFPSTLPSGLRVYVDLSKTALLPSPVQGQQQVPIPIPNSASLSGLALFFHLAVTPDPGVTAPALWLPPGRRIAIR